jgi:serine/threonine protein kinase/tetratricopeptide (TPR) repeat protein
MNDASPEMLSIFSGALERRSAAERDAYLATACGPDRALRARIEALLRAHAEAGAFMAEDAPTRDTPATIDPLANGCRDTILGPYKLLEPIGEGGMGTVYLAEQTHPVQRQVALKVVKAGLDSRPVLARFEAERQVLALMDHPHIAKVLDAGTTDTGRPFFVMELVKGIPITRYCDAHKLLPRQRLELFISVCQAVQHAHQKGVIHRDLKPSNVLVARYDGVPVVKVIDFGVAKAMGPKLTERTLCTEFGAVVGTLEYMSPEQAEPNQPDIDTRSDIYSLGVLLYELLTGTTPLEHKRLKETPLLELLRVIREEEPHTPSHRLDTVADLPAIAANCGLEPKKLSGLVKGELDWIVMKALEKDRNRRYETACALAQDVQRYLADEPVLACPPSKSYRLSKFARRHRGALLAASLVVLALLAGIVGTGLGLLRAQRERQAAVQNARAARQREAETRTVLDFVESRVFAAARPEGQEGGLGREVTLRQAVDAALPFVEQSFPDQPLLEARLRLTLGISYLYLGEAQTAADQFDKARALYREHLGPEDPATLASMHNLANSYYQLGRYTEALQLREETLALRKAKLGPNDPDTLKSMWALAISYGTLSRFNDAVQLHEETLALREAKLGRDDPDTLASMQSLAITYADLGRYADAVKLRVEIRALREAKLGPNHPDTLVSMHNLAVGYRELGRPAEACELLQQTLELMQAELGPDHPNTFHSMHSLALSYHALGRHAEAQKLCEEALARQKAKFGPDHVDPLRTMKSLASIYRALGRHTDALKLSRETLARMKAKLGADNHMTLQSMTGLADCYNDLGQHAEALQLHEQALAQQKPKLGRDNPDTLRSMRGLAVSYAGLGRLAEALELLEETLELWKAKLGPDHPDTLMCMKDLAAIYHALGRHADALKLLEEALALRKAKYGPDQPRTLEGMNDLAWFLATASDVQFRNPGRAVELAKKATALAPKEGGFWNTLGAAQYRAGAWTAAIEALDKSHKLRQGSDPSNFYILAMAYWQLGHKEDALKRYKQAVAWVEENRQAFADNLQNAAELHRFRAEAEELLGIAEKN